ncbi:MAG: 2-dehydropantoate 2-reductase [Paucibacter sp.]|nr:2-dehydropantoate 2-reductase [Roseateles sp.]
MRLAPSETLAWPALAGPILVFGAGSIGCYLGGLLQAAGLPVLLLARPRVRAQLQAQGLQLSDQEHRRWQLPAAELQVLDQLPAGLKPALTLLCVKTGATAEAASQLQAALPAASPVWLMQNGVGRAEQAAAHAPSLSWYGAMVPFNVAELAAAHFHRGSTGSLLMADAQDAALQALLRQMQAAWALQGVPLQLEPDTARLRAVQWAKLLLNLNNPVNALSGLPLREQLMERGYRRCLAALQGEALDLLAAAGQPLARLTPLPARALPALLRLPTPLFRLLAQRMLRIDARARSSMADDLAQGRTTEIDELCGEVQRLALSLGREAPLNARMQALLQAWPQDPRPYSPERLEKALGLD